MTVMKIQDAQKLNIPHLRDGKTASAATVCNGRNKDLWTGTFGDAGSVEKQIKTFLQKLVSDGAAMKNHRSHWRPYFSAAPNRCNCAALSRSRTHSSITRAPNPR